MKPKTKDSATMKPLQCHSETDFDKDSATVKPNHTISIYNNIEILKQSLKTRENINLYITDSINKTKDNQRKKYLQCIDIDLLLKAINESEWLQNTQDIEFCVNNYLKIISGKYKTFNQKNENKAEAQQSNFLKHDFSNFDFNNLYDNLDDIKLS